MNHPFANRSLHILSANAFNALAAPDDPSAGVLTTESGKCFFCEAPIPVGVPEWRVIYHDDLYHGQACEECARADVDALYRALMEQIEKYENTDDHDEWAAHLSVVALALLPSDGFTTGARRRC